MPGILATTDSKRGTIGELISYTINEDSTPLDPSDSGGSVGQLTIVALKTDGAKYVANNEITLSDPLRGEFEGIVDSASTTAGRSTFVGRSLLGYLATERLAKPHIGTLASAFVYYLSLVDIRPDRIKVDTELLEIPVTYPGWRGDVWEHIKKLTAATRTEVAVINGIITLRRPLRREMPGETLVLTNETASKSQASQFIEIYNYNTLPMTDDVAYEAPSAITIGAGETLVQRYQMTVSLASINQPRAVENISQIPYTGVTGEYAISMTNGLPVPLEFWEQNGGMMKLRLTENPYEFEMTLTAPSSNYLDSDGFRISEGEEAYPAFYATGSGVKVTKELVTLKTGASPKTTSNIVGTTIDNPFIQSLRQAYTAGLHAAVSYAGTTTSLTFNVKSYKRGGQEFGNVAGSMFSLGDSRYRVRTTRISSGSIECTAEGHITAGSARKVFQGMTFGQVREVFRGLTFAEAAMTPLRTRR